MRVHFLGVRGSTPAPGADFVRYGGHTSCVALAPDDGPPTLVLDAGTGLRRIAGLLGDDPFRGDLLLSHLHWDHTHGLPFARSLDHPRAQVRLRLPRPHTAEGGDPASASHVALDLLASAMSPPHFPIRPDALRGAWQFEAIEPSRFVAGGFRVEAIEVPHKGGRTFGYRVSDETATLAYVPDHGPVALGPGPDGLGDRHPAARALALGVDVLVHDAQHTAEEHPALAGYGHSAIDYAVDLGRMSDARMVALFHHDPERTDDQLDEVAARWAARREPVVLVASEDLVLQLPVNRRDGRHQG